MKMEKFLKRIAVFMLIFGVLFTGCDNLFDKPQFDLGSSGDSLSDENLSENLNYTMDDFSTAFGKAVFLTAQVNRDSILLLNDMGVDLETPARAARSANVEVGLHDINPYLSKRLSSSKNAEVAENDLKAEFDALLENYNNSIVELVPSFHDALASGLITIEGDEILLWGNQIYINSLEGIATIEIMNMMANGIELENAVNVIQNDIEKIYSNNTPSGRAVYILPEGSLNEGFAYGYKWSNGTVRYRFLNDTADWTTDEKNIAKSAMEEWRVRTGGVVKFVEIDPGWWSIACNAIGQYAWVDIMLSNITTAGSSTVGASFLTIKGKSGYVKINPNSNNNRLGTYMHEFGHTLGLMHEHQRYDRDNFVKVNGNDHNYNKLPEKTFTIGITKVKILFVTIYLPYIIYSQYSRIARAPVTDYDFESIMGYDSRSNSVFKKDGTSFFRPNIITDTDVMAIRMRY